MGCTGRQSPNAGTLALSELGPLPLLLCNEKARPGIRPNRASGNPVEKSPLTLPVRCYREMIRGGVTCIIRSLFHFPTTTTWAAAPIRIASIRL